MEITSLWGGRKWNYARPACGHAVRGLVVFFEFLRQVGYCEAVKQHLPFSPHFPNAIDPWRPSRIFAFGGGRCAAGSTHQFAACRRGLARTAGITRFPVDDTIRNLFKRFGQGQCQRFFSGLWNWQLERLRNVPSGLQLGSGLDRVRALRSAAGALRGPNPRKHGRPSHHPLVAVLAEAIFYCTAGCARQLRLGPRAWEFLKEALGAVAGKTCASRGARRIAGFFDQQLLEVSGAGAGCPTSSGAADALAEARGGPRHQWRALYEHYAVGEFLCNCWLAPSAPFVGHPRTLRAERARWEETLEVPGYTFAPSSPIFALLRVEEISARPERNW